MLGGFLLSAIFLLFAVFSLPYIIFSPTSFTSYFSLSMLTLLFSLFLRRNLQSDGQNDGLSRLIPNSMAAGRDQLATGALLGSVALSLYFSVVNPSYILSLIFCFLQMNAVLFYFFGAFPLGDALSGSSLGSASRQGYSSLENAARTARSSLSRVGEQSRQSLGSLQEATRAGLGSLNPAQLSSTLGTLATSMTTGAGVQTAALIGATAQGYNSLRSTLSSSQEEGQPLRDMNRDQV